MIQRMQYLRRPVAMSYIRLLSCLIFSISPWILHAQQSPADTLPNLPAVRVSTADAHTLLDWNNQYDGIKSIAVQRSADSIRNFVTIGILRVPKKGPAHFTDPHPMVGKNYYRLSVEFGGGLEWFSNIFRIAFDSATIARANEIKLIPADTTAPAVPVVTTPVSRHGHKAKKGTTGMVTDSVTTVMQAPPPPEKPKPFTFVPSTKIFTNPYTGHITIQLEDYNNHHYSIRFLDPNKKEVLRVSRVSKPLLVLDKNNFNSRGIYGFQLLDAGRVIDSGYVSVY